jgi:hypothetical protein
MRSLHPARDRDELRTRRHRLDAVAPPSVAGFAAKRHASSSAGFGLNRQESHLDRVSTTCGSGWVDDEPRYCIRRLTHPLPQVVLTFIQQRAIQNRNEPQKAQKYR